MKLLSLLLVLALLFMVHVAAQGGKAGAKRGDKPGDNLGDKLGDKIKDLFPKPPLFKDRNPPSSSPPSSTKPSCPKRSPPRVIEDAEFDFIVVGAGTAGAAVAARLSEKFTVLLLESGPNLVDNAEKHDPILNSILSGSGEIGALLSKLPQAIADKIPWLTVPSGSSLGMHIQETPLMGIYMNMANSSYHYQTVPQIYAQKREITYPRGNVVGGSSATNSMIFFKGTRRNFDEEWRDKHGLEGWGFDDLSGYFKKFETSVHLKGSKNHGSRGPIKTTISKKFLEHPAAVAWHEAALKLGWPELKDANDPENQYGASIEWQQFVTEKGRRSDSSGYLREAEALGRVCWDKPRNGCRPEQTLHIWTEKFVTKVIIDEANKRAIGVEFVSAPEFPYHARTIHPDFPLETDEGLKYQHPFTKWDRSSLEKPSVLGAPVHKDLAMDYENLRGQYIPEKTSIPKEKLTRVLAKREVILSAGAVGSAQLLMLSGIGPEDHLLANDIRVLADLPVGRHLQDHQEVTLAWRYPEEYVPVNDLGVEANNGFPNAIAWVAGKMSPFGSNYILGGVEGAPDGPKGTQKIPKWHLHHILNGGMETFDMNLVLEETMLEYPHRVPRSAAEFFGSKLAKVHNHVCELSENHAFGTIELRNNDPLLDPFVDPRYGSSHEDNLNLIDCIKQLRDIMAAADPLQTGEEISACKEAKTDEQLINCVRNMVWGHHISGSAPMGTCQSKTAVTDSRARVHEIDGLRVVDASLFPEIPHGNIAGVVYALAEKIADLIKEDYGLPIVKDEL